MQSQALFTCRRRRCDQFDENRFGFIRTAACHFAQSFLQSHVIQPQCLRDGVDTMLACQCRRGLPDRLRQLRPPWLHTAILLQFALHLHDWLRYRLPLFSVHFQSPPRDSLNLAIAPALRHAGLPKGHRNLSICPRPRMPGFKSLLGQRIEGIMPAAGAAADGAPG